ncbi:multiple sugar transport system permease protein [Mesorhizobium albiziae]|uniref:Multiple sugar transport system permease protein n=1 Tax=Neomesorhizobium albiziae TaxID=335020 RepID=A0A1I3VS81_9HYPH|nr:sugar ABC transporter permease [Mesorhizobium albiziae]GLS29146.1 sugar ABC transporter permease [Mesorhizobium albiziae]SFJ98052.1 multiple sugar transport system permease protein [Mesorhizobium albiziae]
MHTGTSRYVGLLYVAPALAFVLVFTAYPLVQMVWMSLHNWSLIAAKKYVGAGNFIKAWNDPQFWMSLEFTLKYTALITPILMILGYLIALLTVENRPLRQFTRGVVFAPVVIGLGASSLLWYWLFSYDFGLINRILMDIGLIAKPVVWFGADADLSMWAVIVSIVWKVVGFGTILFVAAIHAVPSEIGEAAMVDGASYWQRVRLITLPLTAKTILLVTLVSVIGSLLAFDQFYIMTAGQPRNMTATSVFLIYLNSFPYLKLGYGAALSLILAGIILVCTMLQMLLSRRSHA